MRFFIDFEFDPVLDTPISFGMVSQGGDRFYAEFVQPVGGYVSDFVLEHVAPLLSLNSQEKMLPGHFGEECIQAISNACRRTESKMGGVIITCDSQADYLWFTKLAGMEFRVDVVEFSDYDEEAVFNEAYDEYFDPVLKPRHHALNDSMAIRHAYQKLSHARLMRSLNMVDRHASSSKRPSMQLSMA